MYMNLCDEQTLIIKFNLTKEAILKMPEKEIKFLLEQIHKDALFYVETVKEIDKKELIRILNGEKNEER